MPDLLPFTEGADYAAAVVVSKGAVGLHAGIAYLDPERHRRVIHLAWHERLMVDGSAQSWLCVPPTADVYELAELAGFCDLVAHVLPALPYGFRSGQSRMADHGVLDLAPDEIGLTCSTFVMAMFEHSQIALLTREGWPTRPEDIEAQGKLVEIMRERHPQPPLKVAAHMEALAAEVGCLRFRSEEVAAASGMEPRPVAFADAAPAGVRILGRFSALVR